MMLVMLTLNTAAQCDIEPNLEQTGKTLKKIHLEQKMAGERGLSITAFAANASWLKRGAEAPVVTVFLDEKYSQDVVIFAGPRAFEYKISLGRLEKGDHNIRLVLNSKRSAGSAGNVTIMTSKVLHATPMRSGGDLENLAVAHSPIIYARSNSIDKFTDIPLVTYYEVFEEQHNVARIRYTTVFSNEDGGTQTTALMARWGRATDIEWIYEVLVKDGNIFSATYQGANHVTKNFTGKRLFGAHPLIFTVTDNNNFSDEGCSQIRVAPVPIRADLSRKSRETIMDENPWTYRIMAEEAIREGRIDPENLGANTIDDVRNYVYVEVISRNIGTAVSVEAASMDGKTSRSDYDDPRLRISRDGFLRIAVRLPPNNSPLRSLNLLCHPASATGPNANCGQARIVGFLRLDSSYLPIKTTAEMSLSQSKTLRAGEKAVWLLPDAVGRNISTCYRDP